ncbi:MAG: uroporphyrinogen-III synthase [Neisseriaceae bacterium]
MFLVCCSDKNKNELLKKIKQTNFFASYSESNFEFLDIMHLLPIRKNILKLEKTIDQYNYIILVSPNCIDFAKTAIVKANFPEFMVMGYDSYKVLSHFSSKKIHYPKRLTGSAGLIEEIIKDLDLLNKKILIVTGGFRNKIIENKLHEFGAVYEVLDVYETKMFDLPIETIKKITRIPTYRGIIITSSSLVAWLFAKAEDNGFIDILREITFVTWHKNILIKLKELGVVQVNFIQS